MHGLSGKSNQIPILIDSLHVVTSRKSPEGSEIYGKHMSDVLSVLTEQKCICTSFNRHSADAARHLFNDVYTIYYIQYYILYYSISSDCVQLVNHASYFRFRHVYLCDVTNAPQITRKSTGADELDPFF